MCKNDPDIIIKHLGLSDRIAIEQGLYQGKTFKDIALEIGKNPSTVAKEVKRFLAWDNGIHARIKGIDCVHIDSCREEMLCFLECSGYCKNNCDCTRYCPKYEAVICPQLRSAPYVCNPCMEKNSCLLSKYYYSADMADRRYKNLLVSSRAGINMAPEDLQRLNGLISPLIRNGQPLSHIFSVHKGDIPCSRTTVYNYLDQGLFDVRNIDLPRRVRYKIRKKDRSQNPVVYDYRRHRTYKDFETYSSAYPDYEVVEMDTVKGTKETGKCLLTLLFRNSNFMLIFVLPSCTQAAVKQVFDFLYDNLGPRVFRKTFRIILTDNGPEFKDPWSIEKAPDGSRRTFVFYCDPYVSSQKGKLEKNHEFIRYILPKGRSMYFLTEEHARLLMCHINSVARDGLNGQSPFDLAKLLINKKVLALLGLKKVSPDEIILKPTLLKK